MAVNRRDFPVSLKPSAVKAAEISPYFANSSDSTSGSAIHCMKGARREASTLPSYDSTVRVMMVVVVSPLT